VMTFEMLYSQSYVFKSIILISGFISAALKKELLIYL